MDIDPAKVVDLTHVNDGEEDQEASGQAGQMHWCRRCAKHLSVNLFTPGHMTCQPCLRAKSAEPSRMQGRRAKYNNYRGPPTAEELARPSRRCTFCRRVLPQHAFDPKLNSCNNCRRNQKGKKSVYKPRPRVGKYKLMMEAAKEAESTRAPESIAVLGGLKGCTSCGRNIENSTDTVCKECFGLVAGDPRGVGGQPRYFPARNSLQIIQATKMS